MEVSVKFIVLAYETHFQRVAYHQALESHMEVSVKFVVLAYETHFQRVTPVSFFLTKKVNPFSLSKVL